MKKHSFCILFNFLFLVFPWFSFSQNRTIDSLLILLKTSKEDTVKVSQLCDLGWEFLYIKPDSAFIFGEQALSLSKKLHWKRGTAYCYTSLGSFNLTIGGYAKSLTYYFPGLKLYEELKNKKQIAITLGNIGVAWNYSGDYPKALEYYLKALKITEELGDKEGTARHYGNIGAIYLQQGDFIHALENYFRSLKINEALQDKSGIGSDLGNIGIIYSDQKNFVKALNYYLKALKINEEVKDKTASTLWLSLIGVVYVEMASKPFLKKSVKDSLLNIALIYELRSLKQAEELENKNSIAVALGNLADVYKMRTEYHKALEYYVKQLEIDRETGNKNGEATASQNIGYNNILIKEYKKALPYLYEALALDNSIGAINNLKYDYEALSALYESSDVLLIDTIGGKILNKEQMRSKALYYFKKYMATRDTLFSEENKEQLVRKEMNFDFEKKEAATKFEQDKKDLIIVKEKQQQKIIIISISLGLILVLLLAFAIFKSLLENKKKNKIITEQKKLVEMQKELVEEKQKEILDSIMYARRIQRALITSEKYFEKNLNRLIKN